MSETKVYACIWTDVSGYRCTAQAGGDSARPRPYCDAHNELVAEAAGNASVWLRCSKPHCWDWVSLPATECYTHGGAWFMHGSHEAYDRMNTPIPVTPAAISAATPAGHVCDSAVCLRPTAPWARFCVSHICLGTEGRDCGCGFANCKKQTGYAVCQEHYEVADRMHQRRGLNYFKLGWEDSYVVLTEELAKGAEIVGAPPPLVPDPLSVRDWHEDPPPLSVAPKPVDLFTPCCGWMISVTKSCEKVTCDCGVKLIVKLKLRVRGHGKTTTAKVSIEEVAARDLNLDKDG